MFDPCSWIFIFVFGIAFVLSVAFSIFKVRITNKYFNAKCLQLYEEDLRKYNFSMDDSIEDIAKKLGKKIEYTKTVREAYIGKKNPDVIHVNKSLSAERKNFAITHEFGHNLRGYPRKAAARDRIRFLSKLSPEEQICDYYAAAILLPIDDLNKKMQEKDFDNLSHNSQAKFIRDIAKNKCIMEDVVYRRISEIKMLNR